MMAIEFKRIAGAVRQDGKLIPIMDGEQVPAPKPSPPEPEE